MPYLNPSFNSSTASGSGATVSVTVKFNNGALLQLYHPNNQYLKVTSFYAVPASGLAIVGGATCPTGQGVPANQVRTVLCCAVLCRGVCMYYRYLYLMGDRTN